MSQFDIEKEYKWDIFKFYNWDEIESRGNTGSPAQQSTFEATLLALDQELESAQSSDQSVTNSDSPSAILERESSSQSLLELESLFRFEHTPEQSSQYASPVASRPSSVVADWNDKRYSCASFVSGYSTNEEDLLNLDSFQESDKIERSTAAEEMIEAIPNNINTTATSTTISHIPDVFLQTVQKLIQAPKSMQRKIVGEGLKALEDHMSSYNAASESASLSRKPSKRKGESVLSSISELDDSVLCRTHRRKESESQIAARLKDVKEKIENSHQVQKPQNTGPPIRAVSSTVSKSVPSTESFLGAANFQAILPNIHQRFLKK